MDDRQRRLGRIALHEHRNERADFVADRLELEVLAEQRRREVRHNSADVVFSAVEEHPLEVLDVPQGEGCLSISQRGRQIVSDGARDLRAAAREDDRHVVLVTAM